MIYFDRFPARARQFTLFSLFATLAACGGGGSGEEDTPNTTPSGSVTISGTASERELLTAANTLADADGLGTIRYQWRRDGIDISGATTSSYTLTYADIDAVMTVTASYTDGAGHSESIESNPTAAVSRVNDMLVFFNDGDLFFNTSTDSGASWNGAMTFEANGTGVAPYHYEGDAASDGKGNIVMAWGSEDIPGYGTDIDLAYKYSNDDGATWSTMVPLNSAAATDGSSDEDENPSIATNGKGRWIIVWGRPSDDGGTKDDVFYSVSDDNGANWTAQTELAPKVESALDYSPRIAYGGGNNWLVVWQSTDDLSGTIGTDQDLLYSYSSDNGQTWSSRAALDSRATSDGTARDRWPSLAMDANGNAIVVWESDNDLGGTIGTDTDIFVARSSDAGQTWTTSTPVHNNAATDAGVSSSDKYPEVALDNAGNAVVVWGSYEDLTGTEGTDQDIFVVRSADFGANWSSPATLNSDASMDGTDPDDRPEITTDREGNWLVVWRDTSDAFSSSVSTDNGQTWSPFINVDEGIMSTGNCCSIPLVY